MVNFKESAQVMDYLKVSGRAGQRKTKIIMTDHDTGEVLGTFENKVLVPGSQSTACKQFGLDPVVYFPSYNLDPPDGLKLQNSLAAYPAIQPYNTPITCLWCAGRSGSGSSPNEVYTVSTTDRISPAFTRDTNGIETYTDIVPFRYCTKDNDLDSDQRQVYYGRKVLNAGGANERRVYFFKAFDTEPQLHVRYLDGTEVTENMYNIESSQQVEVYVEMRLAISRLDFRDYFDEVLGWDNADISSISLLTAWYDDTVAEDDSVSDADKVYYKWYQDVIPYSKFNFGSESLIDLNRAIDFNYQVYF